MTNVTYHIGLTLSVILKYTCVSEPLPFLTSLFSFFHAVQVQVQGYEHCGHLFSSDLRPPDASTARLRLSSAHIHVVLLPEARCQSWV